MNPQPTYTAPGPRSIIGHPELCKLMKENPLHEFIMPVCNKRGEWLGMVNVRMDSFTLSGAFIRFEVEYRGSWYWVKIHENEQ